MTSGMAHVSGGVMAAYFAFGVEPRHILTAVIMTAPGRSCSRRCWSPRPGSPRRSAPCGPGRRPDANMLDAASRGPARPAAGPEHRGDADRVPRPDRPDQHGPGLSSEPSLAGSSAVLSPGGLAARRPLEGLPRRSGGLLGTRTVLNELIAFGELGSSASSSTRDRSRSRRSRSAGSPTSARSASSSAASGPWPPSAGHDLAQARLPGPARGHPGQLPLGLHRGDLAMKPVQRSLRARHRGRLGHPRRCRRSRRRSPSFWARASASWPIG